MCVFRPTIGSDMEHVPPPRCEDMLVVFRHMYQSCMRRGIPIGILPNIEVSLIVQPTDARYLVPASGVAYRLYHARLGLLRALAGPVLRRRLQVP